MIALIQRVTQAKVEVECIIFRGRMVDWEYRRMEH